MKVIRIETPDGSVCESAGHYVYIEMNKWAEPGVIEVFVQGKFAEISTCDVSRFLRGDQPDQVRSLAVAAVEELGR